MASPRIWEREGVGGARVPGRRLATPRGRLGTNDGDSDAGGVGVADGGDVVASTVTEKD
jgi:hypothetical protein